MFYLIVVQDPFEWDESVALMAGASIVYALPCIFHMMLGHLTGTEALK